MLIEKQQFYLFCSDPGIKTMGAVVNQSASLKLVQNSLIKLPPFLYRSPPPHTPHIIFRFHFHNSFPPKLRNNTAGANINSDFLYHDSWNLNWDKNFLDFFLLPPPPPVPSTFANDSFYQHPPPQEKFIRKLMFTSIN